MRCDHPEEHQQGEQGDLGPRHQAESLRWSVKDAEKEQWDQDDGAWLNPGPGYISNLLHTPHYPSNVDGRCKYRVTCQGPQ